MVFILHLSAILRSNVGVCYAVYMAVFVLGILGLQALLGLSNRRYRLLVKVLPSLESPNSCDLGQDTEAPSHHECMQEFRLL